MCMWFRVLPKQNVKGKGKTLPDRGICSLAYGCCFRMGRTAELHKLTLYSCGEKAKQNELRSCARHQVSASTLRLHEVSPNPCALGSVTMLLSLSLSVSLSPLLSALFSTLSMYQYIHPYVYLCVCVCVCVSLFFFFRGIGDNTPQVAPCVCVCVSLSLSLSLCISLSPSLSPSLCATEFKFGTQLLGS